MIDRGDVYIAMYREKLKMNIYSFFGGDDRDISREGSVAYFICFHMSVGYLRQMSTDSISAVMNQ